MATECMQAIWMTKAHSISSRGLAFSIKQSAELTAISEIPLFGNLAAAWSWKSVALTKSLDTVPIAALSLFHQSSCWPSGGWDFDASELTRCNLTRIGRRRFGEIVARSFLLFMTAPACRR